MNPDRNLREQMLHLRLRRPDRLNDSFAPSLIDQPTCESIPKEPLNRNQRDAADELPITRKLRQTASS